MQALPDQHFLALPRPEIFAEHHEDGFVDTTTLAAHDFDVDNRTGFMPPQPPVRRLPKSWQVWEIVLDEAILQKLQLGDKPDLPEAEILKSASWRQRVREMPILPTDDLRISELTLRRAHLVLAWIMHFFIHSLPPHERAIIPTPLTLPLLRISAELALPPVLTYSDDVLYNWSLKSPSTAPRPDLDNLQCNTLFTSTTDEQEFYLTSARMELRGVDALDLMRATMDELFVGDDIAIRRVTGYLNSMASIIDDLKHLLISVKEGCDPDVFYHQVRPWFRGADSQKREWTFEGLELDPTLTYPEELSGPSAGQSSLIHSLDIFLGVDRYSHARNITGGTEQQQDGAARKEAFLNRMKLYMPRHHRNFLRHLTINPRPLRDVVETSSDEKFLDAYNAAVKSLKELRDAHLVIVALYIVGPAGRQRQEAMESQQKSTAPLKGTGGTELIRFLKDVRNGTENAIIDH